MRRYLPCLAWSVCGLVLLGFWGPQLARERVEPWVWCVVGVVLILGGAQAGLEARRGTKATKESSGES